MVFKLKQDGLLDAEYIRHMAEDEDLYECYRLRGALIPAEPLTNWFSEEESGLIISQPNWNPYSLEGKCGVYITYNEKSETIDNFSVEYAFDSVSINIDSVPEDVKKAIKKRATQFFVRNKGMFEVYVSINSNKKQACKLIETREFRSKAAAELYADGLMGDMYHANPMKSREELAAELNGEECPYDCDTQEEYDEWFKDYINEKFWEYAERFMHCYVKRVVKDIESDTVTAPSF